MFSNSRWFTSGIGDNGSYSRLEVLTLTATKVTNSGVVKLGRLSSLRMLGKFIMCRIGDHG